MGYDCIYEGKQAAQPPELFWQRGFDPGDGELTWNGGMGCAALKTPFSRLSCVSQDPQLMRIKSVHTALIWKINVKLCLQNQQSLENLAIFSSRKSNLAPIFVKKAFEIWF